MAKTAAERQMDYKRRHPERHTASTLAYRLRHLVARRQDGRERERLRREAARLAAVIALGGQCSWCGFGDARALQVDHVDGGGRQEWLALKCDAVKFCRLVKKEALTGKYQLLCANCNWIKEWERRQASRLS